MKKLLLITILFFSVHDGFGQAYITMPADSAVWRYRIYDIDYITQVFDIVLFVNGTDTIANGNTYHKLLSRNARQVVANGTYVPIVTDTATSSDNNNYGGIRESGKQVFALTLSGEDLIYDFNAAVGDSIPAYQGKKKVTGIDSVLLGGIYHKRYLTTDTAYYVIEGVGSSEGLIPGLNDGLGDVQFMCFTDTPTTYSPDTSVPCTYVYPIGYTSAVQNINDQQPEINVFPLPAQDMLHIMVAGGSVLHAEALNSMGQVMWTGTINGRADIPISRWPKGIYYMQFAGDAAAKTSKIVIE